MAFGRMNSFKSDLKHQVRFHGPCRSEPLQGIAANPAIHSPGHDVEAGGQELHCVADEGEANDAPARGVRVEEVVGEV